MALPADHVAPRAYQDGIDAIRDQLAAHAAYLGTPRIACATIRSTRPTTMTAT